MNAATIVQILVRRASVSRDSKPLVLGSNYLMFQAFKPDPDCPKCVGGPVHLAEPTKTDIFTFGLSLEIWQQLTEAGIPTKVLLMPSDFLKGASSAELNALRTSYELPKPYCELLGRYGVPQSDQLFIFESNFKRRALSILKNIRKNQLLTITELEREEGTTLVASGTGDTPLGRYRTIPIGRLLERDDGHIIPIPLCQIICSAMYERLVREGFTYLFGIFNGGETVCANQGTTLADILGFLQMNVQLSSFALHGEAFRLIDLSEYSIKR